MLRSSFLKSLLAAPSALLFAKGDNAEASTPAYMWVNGPSGASEEEVTELRLLNYSWRLEYSAREDAYRWVRSRFG